MSGILRKGLARRLIFFYLDEGVSILDDVEVTIYETGIVHFLTEAEEGMTHLQNCEVLWSFKEEPRPNSVVRLAKFEGKEGKSDE